MRREIFKREKNEEENSNFLLKSNYESNESDNLYYYN